MTETHRQPKGVPVGGQFAATAHAETTLTLPAPQAYPELAPYGEIHAPLATQTLEDGKPAASTFEESYQTYFRPLDEHEAAHGPWQAGEQTTEAELLQLAGLDGVNLGRHRGTHLERDEDTGDPVIVVHTRNGGGNRECWQEDCDGQCTGCIQTDAIPALPTYLRDADDEGDCTYANNYFRPVDPDAGRAALETQERRETLNRLTYFRTAITAGKQPPWVVLSPVRGEADRELLRDQVWELRTRARYLERDRRFADAVQAALRDGTEMPSPGTARIPDGYSSYNTSLKFLAREDSEAATARTEADTLAAELNTPLPPAVAALARAEHDRLEARAVELKATAAKTLAKLTDATGRLQTWVAGQRRETEAYDHSVAEADAALADFDWSASWPGDPADCPPRPVTK